VTKMEKGFRSFCDKRISLKLKGRVYRMAVRLTLLYGVECLAYQKVSRTEDETSRIRMICWICGHTRLDKVRNEMIRGKIRVTSIEDKVRETRLRWFGDIRRKSMHAPVRRCEKLDRPDYRRSRDRPRKSWSEVIRHDLKTLGLVADMAQDRRLWRSRIKVADYR